jgi:hypothetical protein
MPLSAPHRAGSATHTPGGAASRTPASRLRPGPTPGLAQ